MPPTPAEQPEKPARERILDAALRLFYEQGIRAVGVDAIVHEAGATKMSLYRSYASKDALVAAYLRERDSRFWRWFDHCLEKHPGEPRLQLATLFASLARRTTTPGFRGCPMTNAAIEFPEPDHPGRKVSEDNKHLLRQRLHDLCVALPATDPDTLADGLTLLFEGAYASSQTFGPSGPAGSAAKVALALIDAHRTA